MVSSIRALGLLGVMVLLAVAGWQGTAAQAQDGSGTLSPPVATFKGSEKTVLGPFDLHAGLVVVHGRSNGTGNFAVWLVRPAPGEDVTQSYGDRYLLVDAVGRYQGAAAALADVDGTYYLEVSMASGAYELTVEQPMPETVTPVDQRTFTGRAQQVTPVFSLPAGTYTINLDSGAYAVRVRFYRLDDLGGGAVVSDMTGYYGDELFDTTIPPGYTSVTVNLPDDGLYVLYVNAEGTGPLDWTVSVQ